MPPYSTRYPQFYATYRGVALNNNPKTPLHNRASNNALVGNGERVGSPHFPDKDYRNDNVEIDSNPGFVNEAIKDRGGVATFTFASPRNVFDEVVRDVATLTQAISGNSATFTLECELDQAQFSDPLTVVISANAPAQVLARAQYSGTLLPAEVSASHILIQRFQFSKPVNTKSRSSGK